MPVIETILPEPIREELFNLRHNPSEMTLDYLADALGGYDLIVIAIERHPTLAVIGITSQDRRLSGTVRIQRLDGNFAIEATIDGDQFLPATGDWALVCKYCGDLERCLAAGD
jgi:hypothetical protein